MEAIRKTQRLDVTTSTSHGTIVANEGRAILCAFANVLQRCPRGIPQLHPPAWLNRGLAPSRAIWKS